MSKTNTVETELAEEVSLDIPESWASTRIGDIFKVIGGGTPSSDNPSYYTEAGKGIPWITPADLGKQKQHVIFNGAKDITQSGFSNSSVRLLPKGSVLFSSRAPIGHIAIAGKELCTNQGFKSIEQSSYVESGFIFFQLKSLKNLIESLGSGTTFKEVSGTVMKTVPFALPPLAEQKRIVAKIEATTAKIEIIERAADEAENLLQKYRDSILAKAFRGELVPQDPSEGTGHDLLARIRSESNEATTSKKKKKDELPPIAEDEVPFEIPKSWDWVRLGRVCSFERGHNPPKSVFKYAPQKGYIRFIQIQDFKTDTRAVYVPVTDKLHLCKRGDIMVVAYRHIGRISREMEGAFNVALCKFVPQETALSPDFLALLTPSPLIRGVLLSKSERSMIPSMSVDEAAKIVVPIPPIAEQKRIVAAVEKHQAIDEALQTNINNLKAQAKKLRESILASAFSGKLVPQDPSEGTGQELLEQIRAATTTKADAKVEDSIEVAPKKPRKKRAKQ